MADDVVISEGLGKTVKTEDIGGKQHQWVVPVWGPAGTANRPDTATGKPFPVQVRSATGLVPLGEPTDAKSAATDTTSVSLVSLVKQLSDYLLSVKTSVELADNAIGTVAAGAAATASKLAGGVYNTARPAPTNGQGLATQVNSVGDQRVALYDTLGDALSFAGASRARLGQAASNNAAVVKASAGILHSYDFGCIKATPVYVKFYDKATLPNPAADTPFLVVLVPGATTGGKATWQSAVGIAFATGIGIAVVTGAADTDNTAPGANEVTGQVAYV